MTIPLDIARRSAQCALMGRLFEGHASALRAVEDAIHPGYRFPWRIAESPALLSASDTARDRAAMERLVAHHVDVSHRGSISGLAPERFRRPDASGWFPLFIATDFQRTETADGVTDLAVPEIQSFPGNVLLKPLLLMGLLPRLPEWSESDLFPSPEIQSYDDHLAFVRRHLLGTSDPSDAILVDIDIARQTTVVDMLLHARHFGIALVDLDDLSADPMSGELHYSRAIVWGDDRPLHVIYDRPRTARTVISRCLPDELDARLADRDHPLDRTRLEAIFVTPLLRGTARFPIHPQDFFVLNKASLPGNPSHRPRLIPVDGEFLADVERGTLRPETGVFKPAFGAGGRGILGLNGPEPREVIAQLARRYEAARAKSRDPGEALSQLYLWQERYRPETFDRRAIPGYVPADLDSADPVYHELRFMFAAETGKDHRVRLELLAGLTRWNRLGSPASARHGRTPFTGTHGILFAPR